jgi:hypothetical protein
MSSAALANRHHRNVEIVADDVPPGVTGSAAQHVAEKTREILLSPCIADHPFDLAGGDIESGDQGLSAVTPVLELAPLDLARQHRQPRRDALQDLNAGHLVDRNGAMGVVGAGRSLVNLTDVSALGLTRSEIVDSGGYERVGATRKGVASPAASISRYF